MTRGKNVILTLLAGIFLVTGIARADIWIDKVNQGMKYAGQGDYDQAIELFNEALGSDQLNTRNRAITYSARGGAWAAKGEDQKSIADYTTAIAIDPAYVHAYNNRAVVWQVQGEYDKAIADYTTAIALAPGYAVAYNNRGNIWKSKKEDDKALADYTTAIGLDPGYADAYDRRGRIYFYRGQYRTALIDFAAVLDITPNDIYSHLWYHMALRRAGGKQASPLKNFRKALTGTEWETPLVQMFLEEISPAECLKALVDSDPGIDEQHTCKAFFYAGEYYLINGKPVNAKVMFLKCLATRATHSIEYDGARIEMDHLASDPEY